LEGRPSRLLLIEEGQGEHRSEELIGRASKKMLEQQKNYLDYRLYRGINVTSYEIACNLFT